MNKNISDLPNLYIPGAMKSGTSSLWRYLNIHPDIYMSAIKEPGFWVDNKRYPDFAPYKSFFQEGKNHKYRGDASTSYMALDHFTERVKLHVPEAKFIFLLRNPVDRAWSHYWFLKGIGFEQMTFKEAFINSLDEKMEYPQSTVTKEGMYYYGYGLYGKYMVRFYDQFDRSHILVIETTDLKKAPLATVNTCFKFLDLPLLDEIEEVRLNPTVLLRNPETFYKNLHYMYGDNPIKTFLKKIIPRSFGQKLRIGVSKKLFSANKTDMAYPEMTSEERAWTAAFYKDDIALLKDITGLSFSNWKDFIA